LRDEQTQDRCDRVSFHDAPSVVSTPGPEFVMVAEKPETRRAKPLHHLAGRSTGDPS